MNESSPPKRTKRDKLAPEISKKDFCESDLLPRPHRDKLEALTGVDSLQARHTLAVVEAIDAFSAEVCFELEFLLDAISPTMDELLSIVAEKRKTKPTRTKR